MKFEKIRSGRRFNFFKRNIDKKPKIIEVPIFIKIKVDEFSKLITALN